MRPIALPSTSLAATPLLVPIGVETASVSMASLMSEAAEFLLERKFLVFSVAVVLSMVATRRLVTLVNCVLLVLLASLKGDSGEDSLCFTFSLFRELRRSGESSANEPARLRVLRPEITYGPYEKKKPEVFARARSNAYSVLEQNLRKEFVQCQAPER